MSTTAVRDNSEWIPQVAHAALELDTSNLDQQPNCPPEPIPAWPYAPLS